MSLFKKSFKKKDSLRDKCVAAYGEEYGELYDTINRGEPIGSMTETIIFIEMLEAVKKGKPYEIQNNNTTVDTALS